MSLVNGFSIPDRLSGLEASDLVGDNFVIGPMFSVEGRANEYDHIWQWEALSAPIWEDSGYDVVGLDEFEPCCVILRFHGEACGFYMGGQAWIDAEHRGRGLGPVLVLAAVAYSGELPDVRDIGFTEAGYRTHVAAVERVRRLSSSGLMNP